MKLIDILKSENMLPFNIRIEGNSNVDIKGLDLCNSSGIVCDTLSYVTSSKYQELVEKCENIVALCIHSKHIDAYRKSITDRNGCFVVSDNPEVLFYNIHKLLFEMGTFYEKYDFIRQIGKGCNIHPTAVIENGVIIGDNVIVGPYSIIRSGSIIENNVRIGCHSVIGSEGFQIIKDIDNTPLTIDHVGKCHLSSGVYVADHVCICKGLFSGETFIGHNVKINNLTHIAHNDYIGDKSVITANVNLCGSVKIEEEAWIAPNSSVLNRVTVGRGAKVGVGSVVTKDVPPYAVLYGNPAKIKS